MLNRQSSQKMVGNSNDRLKQLPKSIVILIIGVEIVDAENHDGTSAVLVRNPVNESFQLHHSLSSDGLHDEDQQEWMINSLPGCVDYHGGQG